MFDAVQFVLIVLIVPITHRRSLTIEHSRASPVPSPVHTAMDGQFSRSQANNTVGTANQATIAHLRPSTWLLPCFPRRNPDGKPNPLPTNQAILLRSLQLRSSPTIATQYAVRRNVTIIAHVGSDASRPRWGTVRGIYCPFRSAQARKDATALTRCCDTQRSRSYHNHVRGFTPEGEFSGSESLPI